MVSLQLEYATDNDDLVLIRGRYIGGYPKFVREGLNENYLPIWLQSEGYNTYYAGKLFNAHTVENYNSPHVAGWNGSVRFHVQHLELKLTNLRISSSTHMCICT